MALFRATFIHLVSDHVHLTWISFETVGLLRNWMSTWTCNMFAVCISQCTPQPWRNSIKQVKKKNISSRLSERIYQNNLWVCFNDFPSHRKDSSGCLDGEPACEHMKNNYNIDILHSAWSIIKCFWWAFTAFQHYQWRVEPTWHTNVDTCLSVSILESK